LVKQALRMGKPVWAVTREPFGEDWRAACETLVSFAEDDTMDEDADMTEEGDAA
jgi:chromosome partitioning protein